MNKLRLCLALAVVLSIGYSGYRVVSRSMAINAYTKQAGGFLVKSGNGLVAASKITGELGDNPNLISQDEWKAKAKSTYATLDAAASSYDQVRNVPSEMRNIDTTCKALATHLKNVAHDYTLSIDEGTAEGIQKANTEIAEINKLEGQLESQIKVASGK